jgi:tRNA nucleotidyltransferase/poly(A) polymerase
LNDNTDLKEIFTKIFPEFNKLNRLDRMKKINDYYKINRSLLLAVLLIDKDNSHEYFSHKYNISNDVKESLNLYAKNLNLIKQNKDFFNKDIEKNIYLNDKKYLIELNILNFIINPKVKLNDFSSILKKILKSKTHQFTIDGKYLMANGMQQGAIIGKVLKKIEEEWIKNDFKISNERVLEIIRSHTN